VKKKRRAKKSYKQNFSDIHMEFGLDKCAKIVLNKRKVVLSQNVILNINKEIQQLEQGETFSYLESEESEGT